MRIQSILIIALLALLLIPVVGSAKVAYMPFNQIVTDADFIFVGTVIDKGTRDGDAGSIWTDYTFHVDQVVAGSAKLDANGNILYSFVGGKIGAHSMLVPETPTFEEGETVCLMIKNGAPDVMYPVVGAQQGVFKILKDNNRSLVANYGNHLVIGIVNGQLRLGSKATSQAGTLSVIPSRIEQVKRMPAPKSLDPNKVKITPAQIQTKATDPGLAIDLPDFIQMIRNIRSE